MAAILSDLEGLRLIRRPFEPSEEALFGLDEPSAQDAELVEGGEFRSVPVAPAEESGFTHFVDGAQKVRPAFFDVGCPGYLGFLNAAVLGREEREMWSANGLYEERLAVFAPEGTEALRLIREAGTWDVQPVRRREERGISGMADDVRNDIGTERARMELRLIMRWLDEAGGETRWLLVDGGVAQVCSARRGVHSIVGVVKSHRKQYFRDPKRIEIVLGLKPGERSSAFLAKTGKRGDAAYSWYLRLRDDPTESPAFGLIRVEMPPEDESLNWVEDVSRWLLAERAPLSLPDVRFDRLLYPIRRVEMYLKSKQPSDAAFTGMVGV